MSRLLAIISGQLRSAALDVLSRLAFSYAPTIVHTLSLVEAIKHDKHIGVFRRRRKVTTLFRRS